jgi:hypothetical protein
MFMGVWLGVLRGDWICEMLWRWGMASMRSVNQRDMEFGEMVFLNVGVLQIQMQIERSQTTSVYRNSKLIGISRFQTDTPKPLTHRKVHIIGPCPFSMYSKTLPRRHAQKSEHHQALNLILVASIRGLHLARVVDISSWKRSQPLGSYFT